MSGSFKIRGEIQEEKLKPLIEDLEAESPLVKMLCIYKIELFRIKKKLEKEKLNPVKKSNLRKISIFSYKKVSNGPFK